MKPAMRRADRARHVHPDRVQPDRRMQFGALHQFRRDRAPGRHHHGGADAERESEQQQHHRGGHAGQRQYAEQGRQRTSSRSAMRSGSAAGRRCRPAPRRAAPAGIPVRRWRPAPARPSAGSARAWSSASRRRPRASRCRCSTPPTRSTACGTPGGAAAPRQRRACGRRSSRTFASGAAQRMFPGAQRNARLQAIHGAVDQRGMDVVGDRRRHVQRGVALTLRKSLIGGVGVVDRNDPVGLRRAASARS